MVSQRGIEANPEKIAAIRNMKSPQKLRDVQKLTGCLAALSRFISRLWEKALPQEKRKGKHRRFKGLCISSPKSSHHLSSDILITRSWQWEYIWHLKNWLTIFKTTRLQWYRKLLWQKS